jgi:hypothetical protein
MSTRREQLFNAKKKPSTGNVIPATVRFRHDKRAGVIKPLSSNEKMLCALRKALAAMSSSESGLRYYIAGNKVQLTQAPSTTPGRPGEAQSYFAAGRCRVGVCHPAGHATMIMVDFSISFKDAMDERGIATVNYFEPTTIDKLAANSPVDLSALA